MRKADIDKITRKIIEAMEDKTLWQFEPDHYGSRIVPTQSNSFPCSIWVKNLPGGPYIELLFSWIPFCHAPKNELSEPLFGVSIFIKPLSENERVKPSLLKTLRKAEQKWIKTRGKKYHIPFAPLYVSPKQPKEVIGLQIAIRLAQEGLAEFGEMIPVMENYLKKLKIPFSISLNLLEYLNERFCLPEDWKAFRKYVARAKRKFYKPEVSPLKASEVFEDSEGYLYPVRWVSEFYDIPSRTLYEWIGKGIIRTIKHTGCMFIEEGEMEKLQRLKKERQDNITLVRLISQKEGIKEDSAKRWIRRLKNKGLSKQDILEKLKERWKDKS
jgi:hypothetical protein